MASASTWACRAQAHGISEERFCSGFLRASNGSCIGLHWLNRGSDPSLAEVLAPSAPSTRQRTSLAPRASAPVIACRVTSAPIPMPTLDSRSVTVPCIWKKPAVQLTVTCKCKVHPGLPITIHHQGLGARQQSRRLSSLPGWSHLQLGPVDFVVLGVFKSPGTFKGQCKLVR